MGRYRQPYSLYKRGKYWYYRTYTPDGVRATAKSTGQTSKAAARDFCEGLYLVGKLYNNSVTFSEFAAHFYDNDSLYFKDRAEPLAENTIINYQKNFRLYIFPYFEKYKMIDINYNVLKTFRASLIAQDLSPSAIIQVMSVLKHIIDAAYKSDVITDNPFNKLEGLNIRQQTRDAFTLPEVITLYNSIGVEFRNLILFMALTGLRISEAVGVTREDIKEGNGFIYIDLKRQLNNKKYKDLKGKDARPVPIAPELLEFIGFDSSRVSALYRAFEPIKETFENYEARLLCFHSLRHFFITQAKSAGVIESKVEFIAGHKLKKMSGVYTNYKPEDLTEVIQWQRETLKKIPLNSDAIKGAEIMSSNA